MANGPPSEYQLRRILRSLLLLSLCTYVAGILLFFLVPRFPEHTLRNTYISENALLPVAAYPANEWADELNVWSKRTQLSVAEIGQLVESWGGQVHSIEFQIEFAATFDPLSTGTLLNPYISSKITANRTSSVLYAIVRAAKTHGGECIAVATRREGAGLAVGLQLFRVMSKARWLSKDFVLILTDPVHSTESLQAFLDRYHRFETMARAGHIQAAMVLDLAAVESFSSADSGAVNILPEGANGQLSNLDLLNVISLGLDQERFKQLPYVHPVIAALRLASPLPGLCSFVATLASGVPTGSHYLFQRHHIDAVTLRTQLRISDPQSMQRIGRVLEMTARSLNNLVEVLHQSFYFYLLADTKRFVSIGTYMIPFALIVVPLPLVTICLFYSSVSDGSALRTCAQLLCAHLLGVVAFVAAQLSGGLDWRLVAAACALVGAVPLSLWRLQGSRGSGSREWSGARAVAALPLSALLGCGSLLNFSFALVAAVVLVPVYSLSLALAPRRLLPMLSILLFALLAGALSRPELHAQVWPHLLKDFGSLWMPVVVLVLLPLNLSMFLLGL